MDRCKLGKLLAELECPSTRLHNAGNDANFPLSALIFLAIKGCGDGNLDAAAVAGETAPRIKALQALAMKPLSGVKRPKKRRHRKKAIAKGWSLEKQGEIREERRQRRVKTIALES